MNCTELIYEYAISIAGTDVFFAFVLMSLVIEFLVIFKFEWPRKFECGTYARKQPYQVITDSTLSEAFFGPFNIVRTYSTSKALTMRSLEFAGEFCTIIITPYLCASSKVHIPHLSKEEETIIYREWPKN